MRNKLLLIACLLSYMANSQSPFDVFHYQGYLNDTYQSLYENNVGATFSLYRGANKEELIYEETQTVSIDKLGYFSASIGDGTSTSNGVYTSLSSINWSSSNFYYLNINLDSQQIEYVRIMSVPFAMISQKTMQTFSLSGLDDVDTLGIKENDVLKWDGSKWRPSPDLFYDTIPFADSSLFAISADTAKFADTAFVALQSKNAWQINGNSAIDANTHFIGTTDSNSLNFKSNNQTRMTILPNGNIGVGTVNPSSNIHVVGNDGLLFESNTGVGTIPIEGEGTRFMWYPAKAAFRAGTLETARANFWNNTNIGNYSFAIGKNVLARGDYSVAFGELAQASGSHSMAVGFGTITDASAPYSFAAGHVSRARAPYSVALGRGNDARGEASLALGYHVTTLGNYSQGFGFYSEANAHHSTAIGFKAIVNHEGSFVYSDNSSNNETYSTANNQFMVRSAGGVVFYTSSDLSTGVTLPAGSGSWSTLSDSLSKENIELVNLDEILKKIREVNVYEWSYKNEQNAKHIGPMSQSFYKTFGYGSDEKYISTVDIDGVNLAAIKALYNKSKELEEMLINYKTLVKEKEILEQRVKEIEKILIER
jgi:hypothetical protein